MDVRTGLPAWPGRARARFLLPLIAAFGCAAALGAQALLPGERVTYREPSGETWCATIWSIEMGVGGVPIAWLTIDADPRRIVHVELTALAPGCTR
jgi:hypothetical protein